MLRFIGEHVRELSAVGLASLVCALLCGVVGGVASSMYREAERCESDPE